MCLLYDLLSNLHPFIVLYFQFWFIFIQFYYFSAIFCFIFIVPLLAAIFCLHPSFIFSTSYSINVLNTLKTLFERATHSWRTIANSFFQILLCSFLPWTYNNHQRVCTLKIAFQFVLVWVIPMITECYLKCYMEMLKCHRSLRLY